MKLHSHRPAPPPAPPAPPLPILSRLEVGYRPLAIGYRLSAIGGYLGRTLTALACLPRSPFHVSRFTFHAPRFTHISALTLLLLLHAPPAYSATVVTLYDLQFTGDYYNYYSQTGPAVIGATGDYWNPIYATYNVTEVFSSTALYTPVTFICDGDGLMGGTLANPRFAAATVNLMGGYLYSTTSGSLNFMSLPGNSPFTLYLYTQGDSAATGRRISLTYNGLTTTSTATLTNTTTLVSGRNYLTLTGTTPPDGTLSLSYAAFVGEANINGLQLQLTASSPTITSQPAARTATNGNNLSFSVTAGGAMPLSYQWRLAGANLAGATDPSYSIAGVTPSQAGSYTVVITNLAGSITSTPAALTIYSTPIITNQPANQVVLPGAAASFSVGASGNATLRYQWRLNNTPLAAATNTTYTIAAVAATNLGNYTVLITNLYGSATSTVATLAYAIAPAITTDPASQTAVAGASATFTVAATGLPAPGYQWRFNGVTLSGATNATCTRNALTTSNAGFYTVLVTNLAGSVTSTPAALTVLATNRTVAVLGAEPDPDWAADVQAKLIASGLFATVDIIPADTLTPSLATLQQYSALLVYSDAPFADPTALGNHLASYADAGGTVVLGLFSLQSMPGMTPAGRFAADGYLPVTVPYAYTNDSGGTYELVADLPGNALLSGVTGFTNLLCQIPLVLASGATQIAHLDNGQPLVAVKGRVVALNLFPPSSDVYDSWLADVGRVPSPGGTSTSGGRLMANALSYSPPVITTNPASQTAYSPTNATFTVAATGLSPLSYQWCFNAAPIAGATAADYSLPAVTADSAGNYTVIITNSFGTVTSTVAVLTTFPAVPTLIANPVGSVVSAGSPASLSASAAGLAPLACQWFKDNTKLAGQTNATLNFASFQFTNCGTYQILVTNSLGMALSLPAFLSVSNAPFKGWGANDYGQLGIGNSVNTNRALNLATNALAAALGVGHSLFLKHDATLWAMGYNYYGQLGIGNSANTNRPALVASNVLALAAGQYHSLFLKSDGTLCAMGDNSQGQLGNGATDINVHSLPLPLASNVVALAAGDYHTLFVRADGSLWVVGNNGNGQLGIGNTSDTNVPVNVASNVVAVAAGSMLSLFVKHDGTLWAMGLNSYGQLGNGNTTQQNSPVTVASNVVSVAAGGGFSLFVKSDATLWAMGMNNYGQLGIGTADSAAHATPVKVASNVVAVAAGGSHSLFVKNDGSLWAMGLNTSGQLASGTTNNSNVPAQVAGMTVASLGAMNVARHSLAVAVLAPQTESLTNLTITAAQPFSFSLNVTNGDAPFTYQWSLNGANISNATNASYTVPSAQLTDAGTYTGLAFGFVGTSTQTATLTVRSIPAVSEWPSATAITYGQTLASSLLTGGTASVPGAFAWIAPATVPNAGAPAPSVRFTPTATNSYTQLTNAVSVTVNRATPAVTAWPTAGAISYGQTLASSTLTGGTASAAGTFAWTTPASAPAVGIASPSVTFTPTATTNYLTTNYTVSVTVNRATPAVTAWPTAGAITYGQTLASSTLTGGTASPAGAFGWTTPSTAPNAGTVARGVTYTPTDTADYNLTNYTVSVTVNKATPGVTAWPTASAITYGQTLASSTLTGGTASVAGAFAWTVPGTVAAGGVSAQSVTFTPAAATNYLATNYTVSVTVYAPPQVIVNPASSVVSVGATATLSVTALGVAPLAYQWFKDNTKLAGQTNSTLSYASFQFTNSGSYQVAITNTLGMALSLPASLSVPNAPFKGWGDNSYGQFGNGTTNSTSQSVGLGSNLVALAVGPGFSLSIGADGTLWAMGDNTYGQLGVQNTQYATRTSIPVSVASNVVAAAAGYGHALFVKNDGTLWAMGNNAAGQLGNATLLSTNRPVCVASNVAAAAGGYSHSLFVKNDGTLWAMGNNAAGQLGNGTTNNSSLPVCVNSNVVAVAGGGNHSLLVKVDGTLWVMGNNGYGQLGTGNYLSTNRAVAVASNVVAVATGDNHSLYLQAGGTLWSMGYNGWGQLGNGGVTSRSRPVNVATNAVAVAAGANHSLYTRADGTVWGMGNNASGQLGTGATASSSLLPVLVQGGGLVAATLANGSESYHALAVGSATPQAAELTNQVVSTGQPFTFSLLVTNGDLYACQWQHNGTNILNAPATSYTVASSLLADAGTYTGVAIGFAGDSTRSSATLVVLNTPVVSLWPSASAITNGQSLAGSLLSGGVAPVPGTFAWTSPDTVPALGTSAQNVTFTPTDPVYLPVTNTVSVTVAPWSPAVSVWPVASAITNGQSLASSILSGGEASVSGTFAFTAPATMPGAGTNAVSVIFTPDDTVNYASVTGSVTIRVYLAAPAVVADPGSAPPYAADPGPAPEFASDPGSAPPYAAYPGPAPEFASDPGSAPPYAAYPGDSPAVVASPGDPPTPVPYPSEDPPTPVAAPGTQLFADDSIAPRIVEETVFVGDRISVPANELGAGGGYLAGHLNTAKGNLYLPSAYVDPLVSGFTLANLGAIIPVNAIPGTNYLEVLWFRTNQSAAGPNSGNLQLGFKTVFWPSVIGRYTVEWPTSPREIVLASKLGSGTLDTFEAQGIVYRQNDPSLPGYNPNEEHALMAGGTAFATRDDLNLTNTDNYSSAPFVLVSYTAQDGRPAVSAFKVLREKPELGYVFDYIVPAGQIMQAPMPLPLLGKPVLGSGDGALNQNIEPPHSGRDLPGGWNTGFATNSIYSHYDRFTWRDRHHDFWVYRGPHDGLPVLQAGTYVATNKTFRSLTNATAIVGSEFSCTLHASRQDEYLALSAAEELPAWLLIRGLKLTGTPTADDVGTNTLRLVVEDLYDYTRVTNQLVLTVMATGTMVTQGALTLTSSNAYSGTSVVFSNRPPFLAASPVPANSFTMRYYYKTDASFDWPGEVHPPAAGSIVPYLRPLDAASGQFVGDGTSRYTESLEIVYRPVWPERDPSDASRAVPTLPFGGTLATPKFNLPGVRDMLTAQILYQQSVASNLLSALPSALLHDATREKYADLAGHDLSALPGGVNASYYQGLYYFPNLPPHLGARVFFNPNRGTKGTLVLSGQYVAEVLGESYLMLNVLRGTDLAAVKALCPSGDADKTKWDDLVDGLATAVETFVENSVIPGTYIAGESLTTSVGVGDLSVITNDNTAVDSYAISAVGPGNGYVTLVESSGTAFTKPGDPVAMHIFRVDGAQLYAGEVKVIAAANPLSELVTFQHTADLAGRFNEYEYEWKIAQPVDGQPPVADSTMSRYQALVTGSDLPRQTIGGAGIRALCDNYVVMRYRPKTSQHPLYNQWSDWTSPKLAEGWIKRVLAGINPFTQRATDLFNNQVSTDVSMLTQAGKRWEGDVALNADSINNYGLIEIYETVLRRGRMLSIESGYNYGPANDALLLAAGYLNDLYLMVGNEAWADAANPTIGIGTADHTYGSIATALFAFKGQEPSLLEEELALLRGRDDFLTPGVQVAPVYNRLVWNYTRGIDAGEVIYANNYNIQPSPDNTTGIIGAADAARLYPQGHGDAYGHYLTALKGYYSLLMNSCFDWVPRIESVNVLGQPVAVDYQDERKFAAAAAAVAQAGRQIFDLTWRRDFQPVTTAGWQHFGAATANTQHQYASTGGETNNVTRYWGMDHCATRVQQGLYLNWVVGNAILPDVDPNPLHQGIQKIDRTTVPELTQLAITADGLQTALDNAEGGLSPLGIPEGGIAFDVNPNAVAGTDNGTHFEQIYNRTRVALNNAVASFDDAKDVTQLMRSEEDSLTAFQAQVARQEQAYNNSLIELYGTPYPDDIGAGQTWVQGYTGPDLIHYMFADLPEINWDSTVANQTNTYKVDIQTLPSDWLQKNGTGMNFVTLSSDPAYADGPHYISFPVGPHGFYDKPAAWTGRRYSPGRIQQAISEMIAANISLRKAADDAEGTKIALDKSILIFKAAVKTHDDIRAVENSKLISEQTLASVEQAFEIADVLMDFTKQKIFMTEKMISDGLPTSFIAGTAAGGDLTSAARQAASNAGVVIMEVIDWNKILSFIGKTSLKFATETAARWLDFNTIAPLEWEAELRGQVAEMGNALDALQDNLVIINQHLRAYDDTQRKYRAIIAEGDRLQQERYTFRKRAATMIQGYRTRDAAFRIFRNEKLERYKTLFDLTARYSLLAANAYDYETGLLGTTAGRSFKDRIINARALGVVRNGEPQYAGSDTGDPGISSALAEMKADWDVLRGRLGFNNPDAYGTTVSLRTENLRILPTSDGDSTWTDALQAARVSDLLQDPDVQRYCLQIDTAGGLPVPGIVITFSTTIADGYNLFGKPLAAGDHNFSASSFATKIFGVGVDFEGYRGMDNPSANSSSGGTSPSDPTVTSLDPLALAATPYVYLIPVGVDSMRSPPLGDASTIRTWSVNDLAIPMPFNIGQSDFNTRQLWTSSDSLTEPLFAIRKHQAFRPVSTTSVFSMNLYGDSGTLNRSQFTNNRLVGRSVWNSQWKLIIPGKNLLNNPNEGLDRFIQTVTDVKLHFVTYSYSGN